jgi:hypothetical protein
MSKLLGYKGTSFHDTGFVYAPYMPHDVGSVENKIRNLEVQIETIMLSFKRFCVMEFLIGILYLFDLAFKLDVSLLCYILGGGILFPILGCLILRQKYNNQRLNLIMENL